MGLFSSKKSTSNSTTNLTEINTTQQNDVAENAIGLSISGSSGVAVNVLDEGAISDAFQFANEASEREHSLLGAFLSDQKNMNESILDTFKSSTESVTDTVKSAYDSASGSIDPKYVMGSLVLLGLAIVYMRKG